VSKYLADLTLDAIGEMFGSARAIMAWLADCARVVAASNAPVSWSSPLGLPIMQPYHKLSLTNIHTATQSFSVSGWGSYAVVVTQCRRAGWSVVLMLGL
jgi:DNA-directed RNA polymerase